MRTVISNKQSGFSELSVETQGDKISIYDDSEFCLWIGLSELANIPQVKALIEALERLEYSYDEKGDYCRICLDKQHKNDCPVKLALAPFKCLPETINNELL